jgi:transcriptional regulator with XRE-family HTH domain
MSDLRSNLREDFRDKDFRHIYADESLNAYIATQIKVLREQQTLTQRELAMLTDMAQPRIAVLEDVNYSSWSINTLRRIARAFDLRLSVKFETFSSLLPELETFGRNALERAKFDDDAFFHESRETHEGGAFALDNLVTADVFQEHMRRTALGKREQEKFTPASQSRSGASNAAISSAIG